MLGTYIYLVGGVLGFGFASQELLIETAIEKATKHIISNANTLHADAIIGIKQSFSPAGRSNEMILVLTGTAVKLGETYEDTLPDL